MKLIDIVKKSQSLDRNEQKKYRKNLYDLHKEFILKQFIIYAPFIEEEKIEKFATSLGNQLLLDIEKNFHYFKLNKRYAQGELEEHLWNYFQGMSHSILDRSLIVHSLDAKDEAIKQAAKAAIRKKYRSYTEAIIFEEIKNSESLATENLSAYELEKFWSEETSSLTTQFFEKKFDNLISCFDNKNTNAIFRNYMDVSVKNFLRDYFEGKSVKKMKRLHIYSEDLPNELFEQLKELKGHGNLFYYKKKINCLSIRNRELAIAEIRKIHNSLSGTRERDNPGWKVSDIELIFDEKQKRATYQKVIENIKNYIEEKCIDEKCNNSLTTKLIKALLYATDAVMKARLSVTEEVINSATERLKKCVICLKMDLQNFFIVFKG